MLQLLRTLITYQLRLIVPAKLVLEVLIKVVSQEEEVLPVEK